jgi:hypothetical protein
MNFLGSDMKELPSTWTPETLQTYRRGRGWPELSPAMAEKVALAIRDIQDHYHGKVFNSSAEPAFLFQPMMRRARNNG